MQTHDESGRASGPSRHRPRLESLYEMASYHDAEVLLWLLRVCDSADPRAWPAEVARRGGPAKGRIESTMRRLRVLTD